MKNILALGDCNTLGIGTLRYNGYPERTARKLGLGVTNLAYTMATTREGLFLFRENMDDNTGLILIQFGLVDSYLTFRYAPYVLYYPDNPVRKQWRSIVKKYKKLCRRWGFNRVFGTREVVGPREYEQNLSVLVSRAENTQVLLVETIPHKQRQRNENIQRYNGIMKRVASRYGHVKVVELFDLFLSRLDTFYLDETHCNSRGHDFITDRIMRALR